MADLEEFDCYLISQGSDGAPITFRRIAEETVCLGFSQDTENLVEIHVVNEGVNFSGNERLSFVERAWSAAGLAGNCVPAIVDVGECGGLIYYVTEVSDGEFLSDYIQRHGPVDVSIALGLMAELTEAIMRLQPHYRLLRGTRLSSLLVVLSSDGNLVPRIIDLGLARRESRYGNDFELRPIVEGLSRLLFHLLTGRFWRKGQSAQIDRVPGMMSDLKSLLHETLEFEETAAISDSCPIDSYGTRIREIFKSISRGAISAYDVRLPPVTKSLRPRLALKRLLYPEGVSVPEAIRERFEIIEDGDAETGPYSTEAIEKNSGKPCVIQTLPLPAVFPKSHDDWRKILDGAEGKLAEVLLQPLDYLETDQAVFIVEEQVSGFSVSELLRARKTFLEPAEIGIILNALADALDHLESTGFEIINFAGTDIHFHFPELSHPRSRELLSRHVDHWPEFQIRIRCYPSMESVITALPCGSPVIGAMKAASARNRSSRAFVNIASQMALDPVPPPSDCDEGAELRQFFERTFDRINQGENFDRSEFNDELQNLLKEFTSRNREFIGTIGGTPAPIEPRNRVNGVHENKAEPEATFRRGKRKSGSADSPETSATGVNRGESRDI